MNENNNKKNITIKRLKQARRLLKLELLSGY